LLTHTGGFPYAPLAPPTWDTSEGRRAQFSKWNLQWEPGERFEYHSTSGHWVIAEMISGVDGGNYLDSVRTRVLEPLGLDEFTLGAPVPDAGSVAELRTVGEMPTPEEIEQVFGIPNIDLGEVTPDILLVFNDPAVRAVGVPAAGGISNAAGLAMLYQGFLHNPGDLWSAEILADGTANALCTLPEPLQRYSANRTLGLVLAGGDGWAHLRGFGHTSSPTTFGHGGAAGQLSWADPETGMSFGFCTSGVEKNFIREGRRKIAINSRAAQVVQPA
jgi:CubicO group peptidase (beta-lactamase class C family)